MTYDFDRIVSRVGTRSTKWEFMRNMSPDADEHTIPMWVADMDFACAPPIQEALRACVDEEIFGYVAFQNDPYLRSVCEWFLRRYDWWVDSSSIVFAAGVVPAIRSLVSFYTQPGDGIIIQPPVYYPFATIIRSEEREIVNNPLINTDGHYTMDFADLEEKARNPRTTMMILCSPHNPVGRVWTEEELREVIRICREHGVLLVSDEIHSDLLRAGQRFVPAAKLEPDNRRIITCTSPSKTFNLAGLRCSNLIIPDEAMRARYKDRTGAPVISPFAMAATQAAYDLCEDWCGQVCDYLDGNAALMERFFRERLPGVKFRVPEGTYLAWIDVSAYRPDTKTLEGELIREGKLMLEAGDLFGEEGVGYLRLNFACPRATLEEALARLARILLRVRPGDPVRPFAYRTTDGTQKQFPKPGEEVQLLIFLRSAGYMITRSVIQRLAAHSDEFAAAGIKPTVVVQSSGKMIDETLAALPLEIVCDPDSGLFLDYQVLPAIAMSQVYAPLDARAILEAKRQGIVSDDSEGDNLQLPAAFAFDGKGVCTWAHYGRSGTDIPQPRELIDAIKGGRGQ